MSLTKKQQIKSTKDELVQKGIMCHKGSGAAIMICILRFWSLNIQEKQAAVKAAKNSVSQGKHLKFRRTETRT